MKTILTVSLIVASSQSLNIPLDTSIKEMPMVMAHDAATTYLEEGLLRKFINSAFFFSAKGTSHHTHTHTFKRSCKSMDKDTTQWRDEGTFRL